MILSAGMCEPVLIDSCGWITSSPRGEITGDAFSTFNNNSTNNTSRPWHSNSQNEQKTTKHGNVQSKRKQKGKPNAMANLLNSGPFWHACTTRVAVVAVADISTSRLLILTASAHFMCVGRSGPPYITPNSHSGSFFIQFAFSINRPHILRVLFLFAK